MDKIELAKCLAISYHSGQKDRGGVDYVNHPFWVSEHCKSKDAKIVALLHDIIEDTSCTYEILRNLGFHKKIIEAVTAITHVPNMPYDKYIDICMTNDIAREVKFWDMIHNSDLTRIPNAGAKDVNRAKKYIKYATKLARNNTELTIVNNRDKEIVNSALISEQ